MKEYKLMRVSDMPVDGLKDWHLVMAVQNAEPIYLSKQGYREGYGQYSYSENEVGNIAYLVFSREVDENSLLMQIDALKAAVALSEKNFDDIQKEKTELDKRIDRQAEHLKRVNEDNTQLADRLGASCALNTALETDLAKIRAFFGDKAFKEALLEKTK